MKVIPCPGGASKQESPTPSNKRAKGWPDWVWLALSAFLHFAILSVLPAPSVISLPSTRESDLQVVQLYTLPVEPKLPTPIAVDIPGVAKTEPVKPKEPIEPNEPKEPQKPKQTEEPKEPVEENWQLPPVLPLEALYLPEKPVSERTQPKKQPERAKPVKEPETPQPEQLSQEQPEPKPEFELKTELNSESAPLSELPPEPPPAPPLLPKPLPLSESASPPKLEPGQQPPQQPPLEPGPGTNREADSEPHRELKPEAKEESCYYPPTVVKRIEPIYPLRARRRGWSGEVSLLVAVSPEGRVEDVQVVETSGYSILDAAASEAVKGWVFSPAKQGEQPVEGEVPVVIKFVCQ